VPDPGHDTHSRQCQTSQGLVLRNLRPFADFGKKALVIILRKEILDSYLSRYLHELVITVNLDVLEVLFL